MKSGSGAAHHKDLSCEDLGRGEAGGGGQSGAWNWTVFPLRRCDDWTEREKDSFFSSNVREYAISPLLGVQKGER